MAKKKISNPIFEVIENEHSRISNFTRAIQNYTFNIDRLRKDIKAIERRKDFETSDYMHTAHMLKDNYADCVRVYDNFNIEYPEFKSIISNDQLIFDLNVIVQTLFSKSTYFSTIDLNDLEDVSGSEDED